jgi:hypothetical protein
MDERAEQRVNDLHHRLREAAEHAEALRREAADLAAELRNRLHVLTVQRAALRRLDHEPIRRPPHAA